jgi:hypothetical protein
MNGMAARLTKTLVLVGVALAVTASSGAAASPVHGRILGVVPHRAQLPRLAPRLANAIDSASPAVLTFDASYESLINQFFNDVAAASNTNNVYSVATQYSDGSGPIQYQSTFGGAYVTKDPLPASGCDDGSDPYCLTDLQLETEIQKVLTANAWHGAPTHMFFLMTPNGVGSCTDSSGIACSSNFFCAYHSDFVDSSNEDVIYANEPYEGPSVVPIGACTDPTQGFPNNPDSDATINTISHEHNEAITDPLTFPGNDAWIAADGSEIGDLCAFGFGPALGGTPGVNAWNQVINGHNYDLQEEWSNAADGGAGGCVQNLGGSTSPQPMGDGSGPLVYNNGPVMHTNTTYAIYWLPTARNTSLPVVTGTAAVSQTLTTSTGSWAVGGAPYSHQWQRCSSTGTSCVNISGATAATYKLTTADAGHVVRSTIRATNVNGTSLPAASAATAAVVGVPTVTKAPHISGRARVGKKLSGSHGSWTYSPTYRYQWLRCNAHGGGCSSINNATHSVYKLTSHDARHRLRLRVRATNAAGSKTATSSATAPAAKR